MNSDDKYMRIQDQHGNQIIFNAQTVLTVRKRVEKSAFKAKVRLLVYTPGGPVGVEPGDYVIRDNGGHYEVCDGEIFEQTYEEVE